MIDLNRVLTFTEAAEKWGLAGGNTLRQAVLRGKFEPHEIKKSGTVWLTTYDAMHRVFGEPHSDIFQIPLVEIIASLKKTQAADRESFNKRIAQALENSQKLAITESIMGKEVVLYIFSSYPEYENWLALISRGQPFSSN
ncbi:helix-turn-helix domain-containing protein [Enterococcus asini]|uniref:helix-turn-helix domain-containing protein n=1 Tax=Enterococcus asini TaxID=57732 RepID=UPI001E3E16CC|nr:helix-turn-helix domain-containing protein [Enterococcus asini]MDT2742977.1 helix-turn-helix domain-containing protein [Enterococcus asini]MDT2763032.1 helix-turn-helix domain-containing protein [Enterococcus asini]MDT2783084.1 helix-turn-helix domain-containing protein [Enterococcus asini]